MCEEACCKNCKYAKLLPEWSGLLNEKTFNTRIFCKCTVSKYFHTSMELNDICDDWLPRYKGISKRKKDDVYGKTL